MVFIGVINAQSWFENFQNEAFKNLKNRKKLEN